MLIRLLLSLVVFVGMLTGCGNLPTTPVPAIPTSALLPITATPTATPITPTPTNSVAGLVDPDDLVATAEPTTLAPLIASDADAIGDTQITRQILDDAAQVADVPRERVRWVSADAALWYLSDLDCEPPRNITVGEALELFDPTTAQEGFAYRVLVGDLIYIYHATAGRFVRCPQTERLADDLLIALDPVAADMLAVVQRRLANQLDLPQQRIQLVTMRPYVWRDSSLGCPRPDQSYTLGRIGGYRVIVRVGDTEYLYHTDSITVIPCDPQFEQLPD